MASSRSHTGPVGELTYKKRFNCFKDYKREADAVSLIRDVPGMCRVLACVDCLQTIYLHRYETDAFDALVSGSMRHEDKIQCMGDVAQALRELHSIGFVHHDVKLENLLCKSGRWCIADFEFLQRQGSVTSGWNGSQQYVDPIYLHTKTSACTNDVFGFGVCAFMMHYERAPWNSVGDEHFKAYFRSADSLRLSSPLGSIVRKTLVINPKLRCDARDLCEMLRRCGAEGADGAQAAREGSGGRTRSADSAADCTLVS